MGFPNKQTYITIRLMKSTQEPQIQDDVRNFFASFPQVSLKKDETVLRPDEDVACVWYLEKGYVKQSAISQKGEAFVIHIYKEGSFFPLTWVLQDLENEHYFEAVTPILMRRAPKEAVISYLTAHPEVLMYAMQKILAGLYGFAKRVGYLVLDDAYTKTLLLLLYFFDTFGTQTSDGIRLDLPIAHREIASWIGTTRETASLQIEALKRKGIILSKGRQLYLPDRKRLEEEIASIKTRPQKT